MGGFCTGGVGTMSWGILAGGLFPRTPNNIFGFVFHDMHLLLIQTIESLYFL